MFDQNITERKPAPATAPASVTRPPGSCRASASKAASAGGDGGLTLAVDRSGSSGGVVIAFPRSGGRTRPSIVRSEGLRPCLLPTSPVLVGLSVVWLSKHGGTP